MIEIDNKLRKTLKKRNVSKMKTQKLIENFQDNPTKYLKFKELQNQGSQNYNWLFKKIKDALVQSPIFNSLDSHTQDSIYKANNLTRRAYNQDSYQKYFSHLSNTECKNCGSILNYDNDIMLLKSCGKSYDNYYLAKYNDVFKILDVDRLSKGFQYFELTDIAYSPDNGYLSFCIDFIGNKNYIFFTQNIYTRKITIHNLSKGNNEKFLNLKDVFKSNSGYNFVNNIQSTTNYLWVSDTQIIYVSLNKKYSTKKCYIYNIESKKRKLLFKCKEQEKMMHIENVTSENYILLFLETYIENELYLVSKIHESNGKAICKVPDEPVLKMKPNTYYNYVEQIDSVWYICKHSRGIYTFVSTQDFKNFDILHKFKNKHSIIHNIFFLNGYFIFIYEALTKINIYKYEINENKRNMSKIKLDHAKDGKAFQSRLLSDAICPYKNSCFVQSSDLFSSSQEILLRSMSFTHPGHIFSLSYELHNNKLVSKVIKPPNEIKMINSKRAKLYNEESLILRNKNITMHFIYAKKQGKNKLKTLKDLQNMKTVVIGYGSYGEYGRTTYDLFHCLTLADAGYLVVITSVRGDGKLGKNQHIQGIKLKKKNTYDDFVYAINYLYKKKITTPEKCAIWGRSAGGLMIGNVINQYSDLCSLAIMGVPFLMPYESLKSDHIPLSHESHSEWGNPNETKYEKYIKSYDPYLNINLNHNYPNIFIYSNTDDSITMFQESLKYYNKIKEAHVFTEGTKNVNLYMDTKYGHTQGSSFNERNKIFATIFSLIDKYVK